MNSAPSTQTPPVRPLDDDARLPKDLGPRQIQMIAIGSAIGTGLFLGAGGRLHDAGPALAIVYAVCGFFGYLILRALGELVCYRPTSGSFVSYTREFYGERSAYAAGWLYWLNWAMTAVADATAIAIYVAWFGQYSEFIAGIPQGLTALIVVVLVLVMNLVSVKLFGELEFWFALIKVGALVTFLIVGVCFVIFGTPTGQPTGLHLITDNGGVIPNGVLPALIAVQGVVFAYAGIELVGTTAGETKNAEKVVPRAIRTVIFRIAVFYVGSVLLLCLLLPHSSYSDKESPFVTFFESIGVGYTGPIMQLVVITAALSSLNAGMYSTGRILHSMAVNGSAPKFAGTVNKRGVPSGGIWLTAAVGLVGVGLNFIVPEEAFEIVLNIAALGTMAAWASIALAHARFVSQASKGLYRWPSYRLPLSPYLDWLVIAFLVVVVVLMAFDYPVGTYTLASMALLVPILVGGWFMVRTRVREIAAAREGFTGAVSLAEISRAGRGGPSGTGSHAAGSH
ncbi:amino acid permease [Falsarthrobacter nasiphocae]|uniref:L-asparagine permease n=1 Tax=Falsarthrobacter nasiphocae TaxID=189863 RepID=A0AAE4C856_9MICC|nr:amino acid permease [Falsarthrobacter nasiphocae]MDR6892060.1 L-asparagine permease [Falsarthrobacter nasiphocae]